MALTKISKAVTEESIATLTATVASNALTIGVSQTFLEFRSATLGDGTVNTRGVPAQTLVVPSTATLGTVDAVQSRLIVLAIDNAGTIELAVVNQAGGVNLDETTLISTTAIDATADSANVIYSTTARTNVPFRVVGYVESTQATAGTWATSPSTIQGAGGSSAWITKQSTQDVTGSRSLGTTYYNTTGKDINVFGYCTSSSGTPIIIVNMDGTIIQRTVIGATSWQGNFSVVIKAGSSYSINASASLTLSKWFETR